MKRSFFPTLILLLFCWPLWSQYSKIDRHARRAPEELSNDLPALAEYLSTAADSETELARACFTWVVEYLAYDKAAEQKGRRINQSIRDILNRKRGLCMDYARLYRALCERAGLHCIIVDGYAKTRLQDRLLPTKANHSWNAVYAEGQWLLVDATWAGAKDEMTYQFKTSYFFTPPEYFILNHLPQQPMWQLLPCPISPGQFETPVAELLAYLSTADSCYAYSDSIQHFLALPEAKQQLLKMQQTYNYHPTADNRQQLAHAMLDYAIQLDELTEAVRPADSINYIMELRQQAIQIAEKAAEWVELQDWQQQLLARLHINYAIALYQEAEVTDVPTLTASLQQAEAGLKWLEQLPAAHYYRAYAERQCQQLLEQLHYLLDK